MNKEEKMSSSSNIKHKPRQILISTLLINVNPPWGCFCPLLTRLHQADWHVEIIKKKKKLGDNIKLVENLRLNKRHLVGWEILIKSIRKNDSTWNYRKNISKRGSNVRNKKERKYVYTHEFIYHSRSHRISYRFPLSILSNNQLYNSRRVYWINNIPLN